MGKNKANRCPCVPETHVRPVGFIPNTRKESRVYWMPRTAKSPGRIRMLATANYDLPVHQCTGQILMIIGRLLNYQGKSIKK
jgi:hypothetical protein